MPEVLDFERVQIIGVRLVDAFVRKVAEVFMISRGTVAKLYSKLLKSGKTSSAKSQRRRKCASCRRDRRTLKSIVRIYRKTTATKVTAEINAVLMNAVNAKRVNKLHLFRYISFFIIFHFWRTLHIVIVIKDCHYNTDCLVPKVKRGGWSVIACEATT